MVLIVWVTASTLRMRSLAWSEISMSPAASNTTATGRFSTAAAAGPPSPAKPRAPVPQTSSSSPVAASIVLIRLLCQAAMTRWPAGSNVTWVGWFSRFVVGSSDAGPSSPMPATSFSTSSAWMEPMIPVSAPRMPASAQAGSSPSGGGLGKRSR